jgi:hypothetical protein
MSITRSLTVALTLALLTAPLHAGTGTLDQSASPTGAGPAGKMYNLTGIYNRLHSGTAASKGSGFTEPTTGPADGVMYTLNDILDDFNTDATACSGTLAANVLSGKTFFATSGTTRGTDWGPVAGTMPTQTLSAANETVAAGYYAATTLSAVDSDLAVGNIKSGVTIFGFLGTYSGGGVPKTGQTTSYADYDDAWYVTNQNIGVPKSGAHYTNNGDGTITDNATGLEWVADPTAAGVGGTYSWADAITACEDLTYAGHSDWRLPNVKELQSIVDFSRVAPAIDTTYFTSESGNYWSSTTYADGAISAWFVNFSNGGVNGVDKTFPYFVRPVRGG